MQHNTLIILNVVFFKYGFSECSTNKNDFGNKFVYLWSGLHYKLLFLMRSFCDFSIYIYMKIIKTKKNERCPRRVNNFRTISFFVILCDFDPKWSPPPSTSPASMSKFPSGEKIYQNDFSNDFFITFMKIQKMY